MHSQRPDAVAFRRVMSGGNVGHAGFAGKMHVLLRDLAAKVGVDPQSQGLLEEALRAAGTPGDAADHPSLVPDDERRPPEFGGRFTSQLAQLHGLGELSDTAEILLAEASLEAPSHGCGPLGIVAKFAMPIEWQVIAEQVDVMAQQRLQTRFSHPRHATVFASPEPAVMDDQRVGAAGNRRVQQCLARGHAGNDAPDFGASFHLQSVWAIIPIACRFQQFVEIASQFFAIHFSSLPFRVFMRRLWLIFAQTVTVSLAVLFVVSTLKPEWLGRTPSPQATHIVSLQETNPTGETPPPATSYRDAARRALPSVVHVFTAQKVRQQNPLLEDPLFRHFFGERPDSNAQRSAGLGSGVIVSSEGYVLTNYHVVESADQIEVAFNDGSTTPAKLVGGDPESDLAVLRIDAGKGNARKIPAITLGQMDNLLVGDVVLAIGNPFGVGQTVTMGIVSALGRSHLGINTFENFIQTDAAINPGNSGGALVDSKGNLVGINTAIYSRSGGSLGIGFAIPISTARNVMEQIIQTGSVTRGWIGVEAQEITPELAESFALPNGDGALIAGVQRGSPADLGGIKPGDVLLAVNGKPVKDPQVMLDLIAGQKPGETVPFKLRRQKSLIDASIRIGKRPAMRRE